MRLFETHSLRDRVILSDAWRFLTDPGDSGEKDGWNCGLPDSAERVAVPFLWNTRSEYLTYFGAGWFETSFRFAGGTLRLVFGAVMTEATVWLDGEKIGSHYGGFTEFSLIVPDVPAGLHRLVVRADNRTDLHSIPQQFVDWYRYGGIVREVTAERLIGTTVLACKCDARLSDDLLRGTLSLSATVFSPTGKTGGTLFAEVDGRQFSALYETDSDGYGEATFAPIGFDSPVLWEIGQPNLYQVRLSTDGDDLFDRFGFRDIRVSDGKILLNLKPVELRGVCRHEEHPDFGFAFPPQLMAREISILRDLGVNAVRGSHYPNSQLFVDYLDEAGILFWSEIPIWGVGFSEEALADPLVNERGLSMHREMTSQYFNHPSIVIWGLHNEIRTDTDPAVKMTERYCHAVREWGGQRLITFADCHPMVCRCFEYCDIICLNQYHGWYVGDKTSWGPFLDKFRARREELGMSGKPVIMSEFGAAALYGQHTFDGIPWTEEYQSDLLTNAIGLFHADPMTAGWFIWQFADIRTSKEAGLNRARGFNNKGILNEYRKPKAAYSAVRALYRAYEAEEKTKEKGTKQ